jgi:hypothetical protein
VSGALTLVIAFLAIVAAVMAVGLVETVRLRVRKHGPWLLWRWLTGLPHDGGKLPDGRFWARPRHHRALRRILRTAAGVDLAWGLIFARSATLLTLAFAIVIAAAYGVVRIVRWARGLRHHIVWVQPAHLVAAPLIGLPAGADPGWLQVEPDRSRVVAELPPAYNPDQKQRERLVETLSAKLGIESPEVAWKMAGPNPTLTLVRSQPPPPMVRLADVRAAVEAARADEVVWGLGKKRRTIQTSFGGDSPHLGFSMGSGAGKSELAKWVLCQLLFHGAIGLILDHKMMSHPWAKGLPNVAAAVRVAEIHKALVWLGAEVQRRKEVAYASTDLDGRVHANVGARIIVIAEELNATVAQLRAYWREVRGKDDPARSPALTALDEVSFTGRSVLINLIYIGQRLSDKATGGGGDARENIGVIAFARYRPSTWKMLAPDHPMPPKTNHPGRLQVVSDQVQETQAPLLTTEEARELALSGVVSPLPYGMPGAPAVPGETRESVSVLALRIAPEQRSATVSAPDPALAVSGGVTLSEAHRAGVFGPLTLAGLRTARHRDETFPAPVGRRGLAHEYDPEKLAAWAADRKE